MLSISYYEKEFYTSFSCYKLLDDYKREYDKAEKLVKNGNLSDAFKIFESLGTYEKSSSKWAETGRALAAHYEEEREFGKAKGIYLKLGMTQAATVAESKDKLEKQYKQAKIEMDNKQYHQAVEILKKIRDYEDSQALLNECYYIIATDNQKKGNLVEAETIYLSLGTYKDSKERLRDVRTQMAQQYSEKRQYEEAISIYEKLNDENQIKATKYKFAEEKNQAGQYRQASKLYSELGDYLDAGEKTEETKNEYFYQMRCVLPFSVGNTLIYGKYEQDGNTNNGQEPLEWIVLDQNDTSILVTTKKAIHCIKYHEWNIDITWEYSTIRTWLNRRFYNEAFSSEEREAVLTTPVSNHVTEGKFNTHSGSDTYDKIFLLSYFEVSKYFKSDEERKLVSTEFARKNGAHSPECYWMTRSPGNNRKEILAIRNNGQADHSTSIGDEHLGVRPAMWLSMTSDIVKQSSYAKGSIISFGCFGNKSDKTYEPIKWRVVEIEDDGVLAVADKNITNKQFHDSNANISWRVSTLRAWLNHEFYEEAFSEDEKASLVSMQVPQTNKDGVEGYQSISPSMVEDTVTILSYKQILKYFIDKNDRRKKATVYAESVGTGDGFVKYWLLSKGKDDYGMTVINQNGDPESRWVTDQMGVLPMIKISMEFGMGN